MLHYYCTKLHLNPEYFEFVGGVLSFMVALMVILARLPFYNVAATIELRRFYNCSLMLWMFSDCLLECMEIREWRT